MNIVIDTSTLVSAAILPKSIPAQAIRRAAPGNYVLCLSEQTLWELEDVLSRSKFDRYRSRAELAGFIAYVRRLG